MTMLSPLQPPPLVGRGRELALLRAHFDAALAGRGGLVLIGGEAGIGKTALAEAVCREAMERGALVLIGRCYDLTETPPYGPWVEAFGTYRRDDGMPPLPDAFATRGTVGVVASQAALLYQVRDFLAALAEWQPVALLLDDLHWADAGSLDLLRFVARAATALPLLVIVTYRSDELTRRHALYSLLPALAREGNAARIEVRRLDDDAVRALIASRYPLGDGDTERLVAFIQSRTEGNALFASEVLRSLIETDTLRSSGDRWALGDLQRVALPPLLRQVIDGRIARLDAETQRLLPIAAAVGQEAPLAVLGALAAMDEEAVLASVEAAAGANVIAETADGLGVRFAHALIREAVYEGISPARRRLLHRRIGDLLAEQPQPDPDAVAMHFQQASDDRAVAWLVKAGERAQDAYAWATAAQRFETAFALVPEERPSERGWLLLRIVQLRRHAGDHRSLAYLEDAAALAEQAGDRTLAAWARFARGFLLSVVGKGPVAMQETETGAAALVALSAEERARYPGGRPWMPALPHEVPFGPVIASAATFGWLSRAESLANRWMAPYFSEKDGVEAAWRDGWRGMGIVHAARGRPAEARMAFERAARGARRLGHHFYVGSALHTLLVDVALPYETEDRAARGQLAREAVAALALGAEVVSDVTWAAVPEYFVSGLWEDEAFLGERMQNRSVTGRAQGYVGEWHRARGNPDAAWGCVTWMLPDGIGTEPGDAPLTGTTYGQLAVALALDAGDRETAAEWLT